MMKKLGLIVLCLAVTPALTGCNALYRLGGEKRVPAQFKPKGRMMAIVPFADPANQAFESPEGRIVARYAGQYIEKHDITRVTYDVYLPPGIETKFKEEAAQNMTAAIKGIAKATGCQLVVTGVIEDISLGRPEDVNVVGGRMPMAVIVYEVTDEVRVAWQQHFQVVFPEGWENEQVPVMDMPRSVIRERLLKAGGEYLGKAFHGHFEEI